MRPHIATYEDLAGLLDEDIFWWFNFKLERHGPEEIVVRDTNGDCFSVRPGHEVQARPGATRVRDTILVRPRVEAPSRDLTLRETLQDMRGRCALESDREALSLAIGGLDCADELLAENRDLRGRLERAKRALDAVAASIRRKLDP